MTILVTGGAGFIGYHLSEALGKLGHRVISIDNLNEYYDVQLKKDRLKRLEGSNNFSFHQIDILEYPRMEQLIRDEGPVDCIIHLAALAGVRYALDHGLEYVRTNYEGTYNIMELARHYGKPKVIYASSSSVYGNTKQHPSKEEYKADRPVALYGATKKACEELAHSYSHLFGIATIGLRFFTVYGTWGRPDMALFLFTKGILSGGTINVFNYGKQERDFTYVDDIVSGIIGCIDYDTDYDILNLGSGKAVPLMSFIAEIEKAAGKKAEMNLMPEQPGDVQASLSDISRAREQIGYEPKVFVNEGIPRFVRWYRDYYNV